MMKSGRTIAISLTAAVLLGMATAQTGSAPQDTTPAPAYGQPTPSAMSVENPPISSMDQASLEPNLQPRSMLVGGVVGSESLDTNVNQQPNTTNIDAHSVTRLLGGLTLRRLWSRYDLAAAYVGGVGFYPGVSPLVRSIQEFQVGQGVAWKTGRMSVLDYFSYLPEGAFGSGAYGGSSGFQLGLGSLGESAGLPGLGFGGHYGFSGSSQYGSLGESPRITNVTLVEVEQDLSPRSAVTAAGNFGVVHFTGSNPFGLINSNQLGGELGYSHALSRRDQVGVIYGYSGLRYPKDVGASNVDSHIIQALYGHRISGRMDFVAGAGPQWILFSSQTGSTNRLAVSGRVSLRYNFRKTGTSLSYRRFDNAGSGFFAGSESDVVRASATRELARRWHGTLDVGFSHNKRLQNASQGIQAGSFDYVFAGAGVDREFSRNLGVFLAYQYNLQAFNDLNCPVGVACNNQASRQVVTFGASWHFRPVRLD